MQKLIYPQSLNVGLIYRPAMKGFRKERQDPAIIGGYSTYKRRIGHD
jgi:hypothetical protein